MTDGPDLLVARRAIETEMEALMALRDRIGSEFVRALDIIEAAAGRLVLTGLGKSGLIARKIAATLASCGTPAYFIHAAEALHGDSGLLVPGDVLVAVSNSGETPEVRAVAAMAADRGIPVVALCGRAQSSLALSASCFLDVSVAREADTLGLAPTASTTVVAALGDAMAAALASRRGFTAEDFAARHPGGSLGLLLSPPADRRVAS